MCLFNRFRNHGPWKKCVSIQLCDSKYVCVVVLYITFDIKYKHFLMIW